MVKTLNFKRMDVVGATKEEALAKAPFNSILKDATQAYKNWREKQVNGVTDADIKQFMYDYAEKNSKFAPGVGFSITVTPAVADTRQRPYTFEDVKNETGARKYKTVFPIVDDVTGVTLAVAEDTKANAKNVVRALYENEENPLKHDVTIKYEKHVIEGQPIAFKAKYTPSKSARNGVYTVFGVVAD